MTHSILLTWDAADDVHHIVTYGSTQEHCAEAAAISNRLKEGLGWPENTRLEPAPMRKLRNRIKELEAALKNSQDQL